MSDNQSVFSKRLKLARDSKGLTQYECADEARISKTTISDYETGKREPTLYNAKTIATILSVSLDWLCGLSDNYCEINNTVEAFALVLKVCNPKIEVNQNHSVLRFNKNTDNNHSYVISRFLEDYSEIENVNSKSNLSKEEYDKLIKDLLEKYKDFPDLPEYKIDK
jgi:transcriptional regulator with XRE-family HTH domain